MPDRVALYLQDAHELPQAIQYVQYAEERGFEAVWQAESRLVRDAVVPMAAFAATTRKIKVGSGVINNWTRNAALIAATYLTLDDLAPDRILLGIGAWWDPLASNVGIQRTKPLLAMREVVTVDPSYRFGDCLRLMHAHGIRHLPVLDKGKPTTVVSIRDLLAESVKHHAKIIAELERERLERKQRKSIEGRRRSHDDGEDA